MADNNQENNEESALVKQLRELEASMEANTAGVRGAFRMFKEDVGSNLEIFGIKPAAIIPKLTKVNVVIGLFGAALGATVAVLKAVNEEARKYRDVTERLAVINKDRREGSQELLKQQGELLGGLRRNSEILAELQILGLTQVNKNLLELGTRLQISGQSMAGFKELTNSMLRFSSMNEDGLDNLADHLIRISKNTNTTLETLIDATKMSSSQAASVSFLGGTDAVENMASMKLLLQAVGGEQLGGQLVGLMDAISNISVSQAQMLGIQSPVDRMFDASTAFESIDILTKEILPQLEARLNRPRTLVGKETAAGIFGSDLLEKTILYTTALGKLGISSEGLNQQLKKVARQQATEQDKVATMMEAFRARMEEAFSRTAEVQEESTTDFDLSIMALKGSFSTLMSTLAPFGTILGKTLTHVNFYLARFVLAIADTIESIKGPFSDDDLLDRIAYQRELVVQLQDMVGMDQAERQRLLSQVLNAEFIDELNDVSNHLNGLGEATQDVVDDLRRVHISLLDEANDFIREGLFDVNDPLFQQLARLEDRVAQGLELFPEARAAMLDGEISSAEREAAISQIRARPMMNTNDEARQDMLRIQDFIRQNDNSSDIGINRVVEKMEEALLVIAEERQTDRVVTGLDTIAKLIPRLADEINERGR